MEKSLVDHQDGISEEQHNRVRATVGGTC